MIDTNTNCRPKLEGWILQKGVAPVLRVAPSVIFAGRTSLTNSLVGHFGVSLEKGLSKIFPSLEARWGKLPAKIKMLDSSVVWMQVSSREAASELLVCANVGKDSPFFAVERWMEVIGRPPQAVWLRFRGVPLHVWTEGIFELLGDFVGRTLEEDIKTIQQEFLLFGRV